MPFERIEQHKHAGKQKLHKAAGEGCGIRGLCGWSGVTRKQCGADETEKKAWGPKQVETCWSWEDTIHLNKVLC